MSDKDKKIKNTAENIAISHSNTEVIDRFGSAIKEFDVAYKGVDNETGKVLTKSLKSISESKINPEYKNANINQQAGYAAEVLETAIENAEAKINKTGKTTARTDDMGRVNDPYNDIVTTDSNGNVIEQAQMKFVGKNGKECAKKLLSKDFKKYLDSDEVDKIIVPKDLFEETMQCLKDKETSLREQAQALRKQGKIEEANKKLQQAKDAKTVQNKLKASKITKDEAIGARKNPRLTTAKNELRYAHKAGWQGAKSGAVIGGVMSVITNSFAVAKGDKKMGEACIDVAKDTAKAATAGYAIAAAGSLIKGAMQNSSIKVLRTASKTNLPGTIVTITIETSKTLKSYINGEIDGVECMQELGQKGCGMISSSAFATLFQIAVPVPVVGAMIGGMIGYSLSAKYYKELVDILKSAKLAKEERIKIERECEEAIRAIREYRESFERIAQAYLKEHMQVFNTALADMQEAMQIGDIEAFIESNNAIIRKIGKEVVFEDYAAIDAFLSDDTRRIKL